MPEDCSHSPIRKHSLGQKVPNVLCTRKMKNWGFFGEVFLKVWKFSAQSTKLKKKLFRKKYQNVVLHTYFTVLKKLPEFFCPISEKNCSSAEKKTWVTKKNKNVLFHVLNAFLKTLLKIFRPKLGELSLLSEKIVYLWGKGAKMPSAHEKWKIEIFLAEVLLKAWNFPAQSTMKENFSLGKSYRVVPLRTYFAFFRSVPGIFNSNWEKNLIGVREDW